MDNNQEDEIMDQEQEQQRPPPPLMGVVAVGDDDDDLLLPVALEVDDDDGAGDHHHDGAGGPPGPRGGTIRRRANNNNNHRDRRREFGNNNNNDNDNDHDHDDQDLFVQDAQLLLHHHHHRNNNIGTSFLYGMIQDRDNTICSSVLLLGGGGGGGVRNNNNNNNNDGTCRSIVNRINEHNDDVYYQDSRTGRTPLHEACLNCSCLHVISSILNVNPTRSTVVDNNGNTPLHLLCIGLATHDLGSVTMGDILDQLLQADTNTNTPTTTTTTGAAAAAATLTTTAAAAAAATASIPNRQGNTPLHMACMAPESMVHFDTFFTKLLAANNGASASRLNNMNQTPLTLHCQRRNASIQVAKVLIKSFPDAVQIIDGAKGYSPLHYAALNCNVDLIEILLQTNQAATIRTSTTMETPLHLLCKKNTMAMVSHNIETQLLPALQSLLIVNPNAAMTRDATKNSYTPLHLVCRNSRVQLAVVKTILLFCPQSASITDSNNYLPIHYASECGCSTEVIELLLATHPEGALAKTKKMDTALSLSCSCNKSAATVALLIQANPKALTDRNHYGFVPLHCVCGAVQPRMGIVEEILNVSPESVSIKSNNGDTAFHVASGNPGTCVGVIELLTSQYKKNSTTTATAAGGEGGGGTAAAAAAGAAGAGRNSSTTNNIKTENTPLHSACFRGSPFEAIESIAMSNPHWVKCSNNAGYTALQILSKNGRLQAREIDLFARLGGPGVFSVCDLGGYTPLHSAMREETDIEAVRCLIRAYPDSLNMKTTYGDTPLHLACFRRVDPEMVREVALASAESQLLTPNMAGQTPIGIAMDEFQAVCKRGCMCCVKGQYRPEQQRAFDVLATLAKILHYGSSQNDHRDRTGSLLKASLSLHRRDVRLDPAFIRRVLHLYPEEARILDEQGNYPLHIECSIPVEKMSLLNSTAEPCTGNCHKRQTILRCLFDIFPDACKARNKAGEFPLGLMIKARGGWDQTFALILRHFPQALHWSQVNNKVFPRILEKVSRECGVATLHMLITSRPDLAMKCLEDEP